MRLTHATSYSFVASTFTQVDGRRVHGVRHITVLAVEEAAVHVAGMLGPLQASRHAYQA